MMVCSSSWDNIHHAYACSDSANNGCHKVCPTPEELLTRFGPLGINGSASSSRVIGLYSQPLLSSSSHILVGTVIAPILVGSTPTPGNDGSSTGAFMLQKTANILR